MSKYILSVNVIYSLFKDKIHAIYILWKKENVSNDDETEKTRFLKFSISHTYNFTNKW